MSATTGVSLPQYDPGSVAWWISTLDFGSKGRGFDPSQIPCLLLEQAQFLLMDFACTCCCRSQGSGTVATTEVTELVRDPLTTKLSQNAGVNSPHQLSQQASGMDLPGPMPCDSPSAGALHTQHKEEEWLHPSVELVTYELELDTGSCKVIAMPPNRE